MLLHIGTGSEIGTELWQSSIRAAERGALGAGQKSLTWIPETHVAREKHGSGGGVLRWLVGEMNDCIVAENGSVSSRLFFLTPTPSSSEFPKGIQA